MLAASVEKAQLQETNEAVFTKVFSKEGVRLLIEDCIEDEIEEGLQVIGKEGRLWKEAKDGTITPGTVNFVEGETGRTFHDQRVAFGISNNQDEEFPETYPCASNDEVCTWEKGDLASFGERRKLSITTVESDLKRYVKQGAIACMEEYFDTELGIDLPVDEKVLDFVLDIENSGILLQASYPLTFTEEGREVVQLTNFDLVYKSQIRDFLLAAVSTPLNSEARDSGYDIKTNLVNSPNYVALNIEYNEEENENGDWLYSFSLPSGIILANEPYTFSYVVQNRPPALSYVQRNACGDYDVLIVKGDEDPNYNLFEEVLSVVDPDGDEDLSISLANDQGIASLDEETLIISGDVDANYYSFDIIVEESPGSFDSQTVRVLVDEKEVTNELDCFGFSTRTEGIPGYILEEKSVYPRLEAIEQCDSFHPFRDSADLVAGEMTCGFNNREMCANIPPQCQGKLAWDYPQDGLWCHGTLGCSDICTEADGGLVYLGISENLLEANGIHELAKVSRATKDDHNDNFKFSCQFCSSATEGNLCDSNLDGTFGTCLRNRCND